MERTLLIYSLVTVVSIYKVLRCIKFYLPCHKHGGSFYRYSVLTVELLRMNGGE